VLAHPDLPSGIPGFLIHNSPSDMRPKLKRTALWLGLWLLLIFATSSTVVPFSAFIRSFQSLSTDTGFKGWFAGFWLANWFLVVKSWHAAEYATLATPEEDGDER
jgi:hypothetical protein